MSLIATARALDDPRFVWRVKAATLTVASTKVSEPDGVEQWYAEYILDRPMEDNITMAALVACNTSISAMVTVDSFNTVSTEGVPDSDIIYVVSQVWATVAARWDESQHPPTPTP